MIWYIENLDRSRRERERIEALSNRVGWLISVKWRVDESMRLVWDAYIVAGDRKYPVSLRYPNHFPHSPPLVLPRGEAGQWSSHQYGAGGELCLEFGSDNWHPDITGADMIQSAYRLLQGENPRAEERGVVATRHAITLGQDLRGKRWRFLITRALVAKVEDIPAGVAVDCQLVGMFHSEGFIFVVRSITAPGGETWNDDSVPTALDVEEYERSGIQVRLQPAATPPSTESVTRFLADLARYGITLPGTPYVVLLQAEKIRAFYLWIEDDRVTEMSPISPQAAAPRVDDRHASLSTKTVGIVGCGSLGSKLAVMLARSGVGRFLLVDDDIMLPDNFIRHDLDWRDAGTHKADSVARRISLVNPAASCEVRRHRLGGQEASGNVETLIESLAACDLLFDATADATVFNYLCAAVAVGNKPLVWAEVFGGGFGGMIARHRPSKEPEPASMRRAIEDWCAEKNRPVERSGDRYDDRGGDTPLIADDAEVTVIASHAAHLAIDTLAAPQASAFPKPVYFIGLGKWWIFSQPFETYPVDVGSPAAPAVINIDPAEATAELKRIIALYLEGIDGNSSAPADREAPEA